MIEQSAADSIAVYLGVDVSKDWLDVCARSAADQRVLLRRRIDVSQEAIARLTAELRGPTLVVLEATGCYSRLPTKLFEAAGCGVYVGEPAGMRQYARSLGRLEKSDPLDADAWSRYGCERKPRPRRPPRPIIEQLQDLAARRAQLVGMRAAERMRLKQTSLSFIEDSIRELLATLGERIEECERRMRELAEGEPELAERIELLRSAPGVGEATALRLAASMPELGELSRGKAAKLSGTAPLVRQSGKREGPPRTGAGRTAVRSALYMAALSAVRTNAYFRNFYLKLQARGKAKKVALIAVARKLLAVLNRMLASGKPFDPSLLGARS